jgi:hypothetical protein
MRKQQAPARSLVAIIEDMMISESKRYVELRFLRESLPFDRRAHIDDAMIRIRTTMDRLGRFRASVLCLSYVGISFPMLSVHAAGPRCAIIFDRRGAGSWLGDPFAFVADECC